MAAVPAGYFYKEGGYWAATDGTGPYSWDGTTMTLIGTGGGGHVIEDEGTPLTQRDNLNFAGAGVTAADTGGKTVVTVPGVAGDPLIVAAGDLIVGTGASTAGRLAIGNPLEMPRVNSAGTALEYVGGRILVGRVISTTPITDASGSFPAIGTTETGVATITVPGGLMGLNGLLTVESFGIGSGGAGSKDVTFRVGTIAGGFNGATEFGGAQGWTTQLSYGIRAHLWNESSATAQRITVIGDPDSLGAGANPLLTAAIDTTADFNIYLGMKHGTLNGGNSMTPSIFSVYFEGSV